MLLLACACSTPRSDGAFGGGPRLAHAVYFDVTNDAESAELARDCERLLAGIPGVLQLEVGRRAEEFDRPVNDAEFDVALFVVFADRGAHDGYQVHPRHRELVESWTPRLASLRVCDYWLR